MEKVKKERTVFGINIDKELKRKLKVYCANNNKTLTEAIEEALEEYLQKRGVK
jgi:metal-responsive CopG/Arc/MetJ family transcriptional regulator